MKQSKFSLADAITVMTALGYGFVCFLSINFFTLGNTNRSILTSLIITLLLMGTALGAAMFKRTSRNFKSSLGFEVLFVFLLSALTILFAYTPFSHYFTVFAEKEQLQAKLNESILQAENMFAEYERYAENRENLYRSNLKSVVATKSISPREYQRFGFENNGIPDSKQIESKMFTVHADLFPSNYKEMKKADSTWLADARGIVKNWKPIAIVKIVKDVEQNSNDWLAKLIELSKSKEKGELAADFTYTLSFEDVKSRFVVVTQPHPVAMALAMAVYILMLISWIASKRHPRFPGFKMLFATGKNADNVL